MNKFETIQPLFEQNIQATKRSVPSQAWEKESIGVNAVFGIAHTELPARFLAGFIAPFSLTDALVHPKHVPPELRIFIPVHLSVATGVDELTAQERKHQGLIVIKKFQELFYPNIVWQTDEDVPISDHAISRLIRLSELAIQKTGETDGSWKKILASATRRGDTRTAFIYGPHHVFGWQDAWDRHMFFESKPKWITINCLSKQEQPFTQLRQDLIPILEEHNPEVVTPGVHINMTTIVCRRPHYLLAQAEGKREPTMSELFNIGVDGVTHELQDLTQVSSKFKEALRDITAVDKHIGTLRLANTNLPNFQEFIEEVAQKQ